MSGNASAADESTFRKVMGRFATGVTVVTTVSDGEIHGMTANAFMAVSLAPPLCVISVGAGAKMHARLLEAGFFGVTFLGEQQAHLAQHFAGRKIAAVEPRFDFLGRVAVLGGGVGRVAAEVIETTPCGDHTLFIGRILGMETAEHEPLLFYGGRYAALDREQRLERMGTHSFW